MRIRRELLPSKTTQQLFHRKKNRVAGNAPDNRVKVSHGLLAPNPLCRSVKVATALQPCHAFAPPTLTAAKAAPPSLAAPCLVPCCPSAAG